MFSRFLSFGWVSFACLLAVVPSISHGALELARGGQTAYRIVLPATPNVGEELAAKELSIYLQKATGVEFTVVQENELAGLAPCLYVGRTKFAAAQGIDVSGFGREESLLRTVRKNVILTGGQLRGALHAVYEFLEEQVGCYWLDARTEVVPTLDVLRIPSLNSRREPAFWHRHIYTAQHQCWGNVGGMFRLRSRASHGAAGGVAVPHYGPPRGCHTFFNYSKDWPEGRMDLFSMNEQGDRVRPSSASGPGHMCVTNPEVAQRVLGTLREFIGQDRRKERPNGIFPRVYDISQNDNNRWICCCPDCKKLEEAEGGASGPLLQMINQVADGVRDDYPDVLVQTFAYTSTQKPPKTIRPRENVLVRLCHLGAEFRGEVGGEYFRPARHRANRTFRDYLRQWSRIAPNLAIWDYWIMYREEFPNPYHNVFLLKGDIQLMARNHVQTVFVECEKPEVTSFFALKRWLGYQLLDNPTSDDDKLIGVFIDGYYGPAAPQMLRFLKQVHRLQMKGEDRLSIQKTGDRTHWTPTFFIAAEQAFDEAEAACEAGSLDLLHVRRERIPLDSALFNLWEKMAAKLPKGKTLPFDRKVVLDRYEAYRLEQMVFYRPKNLLPKGKLELAAEVTRYRERPLVLKRKALPPPEVSVPRVPSAKGDPEAVAWDKGVKLDKWYSNLGETSVRKLSGALGHDGEFLYIKLAEACDPKDLVSRDEIWTGDDWEIFLAPAFGKVPYRQIACNPAGKSTPYHWEQPIGKGSPKKWTDSGARIVSRVAEDGWSLLVAIPFAQVTPNGVKPGDTFYANFYRASNNIKEVYAWSPNFGRSFHVLDRLGSMTLE